MTTSELYDGEIATPHVVIDFEHGSGDYWFVTRNIGDADAIDVSLVAFSRDLESRYPWEVVSLGRLSAGQQRTHDHLHHHPREVRRGVILVAEAGPPTGRRWIATYNWLQKGEEGIRVRHGQPSGSLARERLARRESATLENYLKESFIELSQEMSQLME